MIFSPKKFNIQYQSNFNSPNKNTIKVWVSKLLNYSTQKIEYFSISHKPQEQYKDNKGNKILYFEFKDQKKIDIQIDIKATLWKNKINLIEKNIFLPRPSSKIFQQYTKNEKFLEQTSDIKKLSYKITKNDKSILYKIYSITKFLEKNFKYTYPVKKRGVKNLNLDNLHGDCGEVGALFVVMCRILGIPAINQTGYIIYYDDLNNIYEHGWASIYLKPYGWIYIDPMANNISKKINGEYKYYQKNYFLTFTKGFNTEIKPIIPTGFKIDYWNKIGLPFTNNSVQVLQPIVFSSKKDIEFKDKIKLIS